MGRIGPSFVKRLGLRLRRDDLIGRPGSVEFVFALTPSAEDDPYAVVEIRRDIAA